MAGRRERLTKAVSKYVSAVDLATDNAEIQAANIRAYSNAIETAPAPIAAFTGTLWGLLRKVPTKMVRATQRGRRQEGLMPGTGRPKIVKRVSSPSANTVDGSILSKREGIDLLERQGVDSDRAKAWWDSGDGQRTVEELVPGNRYVRYSQNSHNAKSATNGSFLTDRTYGTAAEAKDALDIRGTPPELEQVVEIVDVGQPVFGIRSGVADGAPGATQVALPRRDVYRVVSERRTR